MAALLYATGDSQSVLGAVLGMGQAQVSRRQRAVTAWTLADYEPVAAYYGIDVFDLVEGPARAVEALSAVRRCALGRPGRPRRPAADGDTMPPGGERRALREELNLSQARLVRALGVSGSTGGGWEAGRVPSGEARVKYGYFLEGARARQGCRGGRAEPPGEPEPGGEVVTDAEQAAGHPVRRRLTGKNARPEKILGGG